jgi:hypothetical protein
MFENTIIGGQQRTRATADAKTGSAVLQTLEWLLLAWAVIRLSLRERRNLVATCHYRPALALISR